MFKIFVNENYVDTCTIAILVPQKALKEAGFIITVSENLDASSKHEFHAMSQMAYFQYQDDELEVKRVEGEVHVDTDHGRESIESGLLLYRDGSGGFHVLVHEAMNSKKLLEAAYRFCTRWVRLDI